MFPDRPVLMNSRQLYTEGGGRGVRGFGGVQGYRNELGRKVGGVGVGFFGWRWWRGVRCRKETVTTKAIFVSSMVHNE